MWSSNRPIFVTQASIVSGTIAFFCAYNVPVSLVSFLFLFVSCVCMYIESKYFNSINVYCVYSIFLHSEDPIRKSK